MNKPAEIVKKLVFLISVISLTSCEDECEECFLIEQGSSGTIETSIGEFCGDEIEEQESAEYIAVDGPVYVECE